MKKINNEKGITLTILIITIIVLLIIAGVSITGAITGVDNSSDNRAITDLEKVQHAITQRYSKYKLLKDTSLLVGTKIDLSSLTDVPESINWRVFQPSTDTNPSTNLDRKYYRLSKADMETLGLTGDYKGASYIVNYCSGEVYDKGQKQTSDGKVLYKTAISEEISGLGDEVIQDGLQVWYDAINNTGSGHSNSTKTWFDLSGNRNNGKMTDITIGSNYSQFNGTSSWVNLGEMNDFTNQITLEATISIDSTKKGEIICNQETGGVCVRISGNRTEFFVYIKNVGYIGIICSSNIKLNNTYHILCTYNGENIKTYINGIYQENVMLVDGNYNQVNNFTFNNAVIKKTNDNTVMALGTNPHRANPEIHFFNGKIYSAKIYNRALSADEVKHNYILDKNRYGIEE